MTRSHVEQKHYYICTNKECIQGVPTWEEMGRPSTNTCHRCGKPLRLCNMEPRK